MRAPPPPQYTAEELQKRRRLAGRVRQALGSMSVTEALAGDASSTLHDLLSTSTTGERTRRLTHCLGWDTHWCESDRRSGQMGLAQQVGFNACVYEHC